MASGRPRRLLIGRTREQGQKQRIPGTGNAQIQKELSPFVGNSYIERFKSLMTALARASSKSLKNPPPAPSLLEVSEVACKIIFTTPVTEMKHVERVTNLIRAYFNLERTTKDDENSLIDILFTVFMKKLYERLTFKKRLRELLKDRQIPLEKKEQWLQYQYEVQGRLLKETDGRSITFIKEFFYIRPIFVYRILEVLLTLPNDEEMQYDFMGALLKSIRKPETSLQRYFPDFRKSTELLERFQNIKKLAEESRSVPQMIKILLTEHWNERFDSPNLGLKKGRIGVR